VLPRIRPAEGPRDLAVVRELFREYADGLGVDLAFQDFERELRELPGDYVPPRGALFLAESDPGSFLGCVALRPLDATIAEMKRLYLRPSGRGTGLGRRLAVHVIDEARRLGYRTIRLDTLPSMAQAIALYRTLGFREIPPYRHNPVPGALFLERILDDPVVGAR
jgi:ribosomal protein S18 acetylase RimI-like enzyme